MTNNQLITLRLQPGLSYRDLHVKPAEDNSADPILIAVPLYPGAILSSDLQDGPSLDYPATPYLKSAYAAYRLPIGLDAAEEWYREAFTRAGFTVRGWGKRSAGDRLLSRGVRLESTAIPRVTVHTSFQPVSDDVAHLLYVATVETVPPRPRDTYLPSHVDRIQITYIPWPSAPLSEFDRRRRYRTLTDTSEIRELVTAINTHPEIAAGMSSSAMDVGQGAWMLFEPLYGKPIAVEVRPAQRGLRVGHGRALRDVEGRIWKTVERLMAESRT